MDWSQFGGAIAGALVGGIFTLLGAKTAIDSSTKQMRHEFDLERNANHQMRLKALCYEVDENLKTLSGLTKGQWSLSMVRWRLGVAALPNPPWRVPPSGATINAGLYLAAER